MSHSERTDRQWGVAAPLMQPAGAGLSLKQPKRLVASVDIELCTVCSACEVVCPTEAITVQDSTSVDHDRCIGCGQCAAVCPVQAISFGAAGDQPGQT